MFFFQYGFLREITVEEAREVIKIVDPTINPPALEACLSRGFDYFGLVPAATKTEVESFIQMLRFGDTNRFGRPPEIERVNSKVERTNSKIERANSKISS